MREREFEFCRNFVDNGGVAQDAAIKAGYSPEYAQKRSYQLVKKPHIIAEIERQKLKRAERMRRVEYKAEWTAADTINRMGQLAFAQILDFVKADPEIEGNWIGKSPDELTPAQKAAVASFKAVPEYERDANGDIKKPRVLKRYEYRYTLHDPPAALANMFRHFGLFDDKLRLIGSTDNRFKNLSPEQLAALKDKIIAHMNAAVTDAEVIEGETDGQKMLSDDRGS